MNSNSKTSSRSGFTLVELLVIIGFLIILVAMVPFATPGEKRKAQRVNCVNNLRECYVAFKMWAPYQIENYPMAVSTNIGGTMEYNTGADTFRHFLAMSNEVSTLKILICPSDTRMAATNFVQLNNQNISYFLDLDAAKDYPERILIGDRNITADNAPVNGILKLVPGKRVGWTKAMHVNQGNIILTDGSVQQCSDTMLQTALQNSGSPTNTWRISLPE